GCDSILITLDLTIIPMAPALIEIDRNIASTTLAYAGYQWYKNGVVEPGATNRTYTITENGDYMVAVISEDGCTDTSDVYQVNNLSVSTGYTHSDIRVYPNPVKETLYIDGREPYKIRIIDMHGKT